MAEQIESSTTGFRWSLSRHSRSISNVMIAKRIQAAQHCSRIDCLTTLASFGRRGGFKSSRNDREAATSDLGSRYSRPFERRTALAAGDRANSRNALAAVACFASAGIAATKIV